MSALSDRPITPYPPIQNGKEKRGGLILPKDFARIPPAALIAHLRASGADDITLESLTTYAFLSARQDAYVGSNAYYDGTNWQRYDTALPAAAVFPDRTGALTLYTVAAGANPITWTVTSATAAQFGLLASATSSAFATTLALRNASGFLDSPAWTGLSYAANWSDFGAGEPTGAYHKNVMGWVELKGLVKKSIALALPDAIATLPVGFRPATNRHFVSYSAAGFTAITVASTGVVQIQAGGSAANTGLDGIAFDPAV